MTNNLDLDQLADNQSQKTVTINDQSGQLDAAITAELSVVITNTNAATLTAEQLRRNVAFSLDEGSPVPDGAITITVPSAIIRGLFFVRNTTSFTATVTISGQSLSAPTVAAGETGLLYSDGTNVLAVSTAGGGGGGSTVIDWKESVRVATTAAGTLVSSFENGDTVDGVVLATGDRILIKDQAAGAENGVYTVNAVGAPTRATDFDEDSEVTPGAAMVVEEGTTNADQLFVLTTNGIITVGTTALSFSALTSGTSALAAVEDDGVEVATSVSRLNFTGAGVVATDSGSGEVQVAIAGAGTVLVDWKDSVRAATTAAGTLASSFENGDTIDGVVLATGDRILIKDQAAGAENGIYTVNATGAPTRATDFDADAEVTPGAAVVVEEGTANADTLFILTTNGTITVGTTALSFASVGNGGASALAAVEDDGVEIATSVSRLNFTGAGVVVTDSGSGEVGIAIAGGGGGGGSTGYTFDYDIDGRASPGDYTAKFLDKADWSTLGSYVAANGTATTVALTRSGTSTTNAYDLTTRSGQALMQPARGNQIDFRYDQNLDDGDTVVVKMYYPGSSTSGNNYHRMGICLNDDDTGWDQGNYFACYIDGTDNQYATTFDGTTAQGSNALMAVTMPIYFRLQRSGNLYRYWVSQNGQAWNFVGLKSISTAPTNFFIFADNGFTGLNQTYGVAVLDYVKHVASTAFDPF